MKKFTLISLLWLLILASSCSKYDYNDVNVNYEGEWAVPMVSTRLDLGDIMAMGADNIKYEEDGLIKLVYEGNHLGRFYISDFLTITQQHFAEKLEEIVVPPIPFVPGGPTSVNLSDYITSPVFDISIPCDLEDLQLNKIVMKGGKLLLNLKFANIPSISMVVKAKFENLFQADGVTPVTVIIDINKQPTCLDLSGLVLKMPNRRIDLKLEVNPGEVTLPYAGETINIAIDFLMNDIKYSRIDGYFGHTKMNYRDTIHVKIFDQAFSGNFNFEAFNTSINVKSSVGAPIGIKECFFKALPRAGKLGMNITDMRKYFFLPKYHGGAMKELNFSFTTGELADAVSQLYEMYEFSYDIELNPLDEDNDGVNYITDESMVELGLAMDIPLWGSATDVMFVDTMAFNMPEIDVLNHLAITTDIVNNFPLDMMFQVYFVDANNQLIRHSNGEIATLFPTNEPVIKAAIVNDADCKVRTPTRQQLLVTVPYESVRDLAKSKYMIMEATVNTKGLGESKIVKLYNDGYFDVKLGVKIQANISAGNNK